METLERVTGYDLDGDGTVAGDIVYEVSVTMLSCPSSLFAPFSRPFVAGLGDLTNSDLLSQDEDLDITGLSSKAGGKTRFSRTAWGEEILDLVGVSISLMYQPELQVLVPLPVLFLTAPDL
jgi:hypothetical protein